MTGRDDELKRQFGSLYRALKNQAVAVADELRESAARIRRSIDEKQLERERRKLFEILGEHSYKLYQHGRQQMPEVLKDTIEKINSLAGKIVEDERAQEVIDAADEAVRSVFEDVGQAIEKKVQKSRLKGQGESDVNKKK